ncbi:NAD(P)/FAD-dependent oxidoreductase [Muricauda oceani]|jgi:NADH dehydrogenase|uniref:NADH:ubiquinone reductase (non-electrogenic) n=3 Tax=Flagellimonas TaxID=444459 RepID=A0A371JVS1_9FLAO|nr:MULTISPECIES: NAD(P)/FAD-dependent oxidoreductase [Allomuricauda]MBO6534195.1 NAD(P)/FAD-dependent oxidoreductase [Allomuricauda sp.]MBO6589738.1 NAD(P)/FAD-dependent oxidoreductase [Allomuricauda sp.]MBO6619329.1 NAD(P)/FAD-dependent oxidoreductase [Allomuricauda sp.]MBO6645240.1 NAD(P)/FAD-dependent oxidoreductase [Allomuricauda sp.]MBO6747484.1 NAD(P)/FAD-dependent oxidoreductase [Allomuricauda sp.]|tara:strand:+ start:34445 stop:35797 length:1353 start_codon:yes stop_codon:yes gene_type:complete
MLDDSKNNTRKVTDAICLPHSRFPRIVIVGGGFAGLALVEGLKNKDVQVVLIDRHNFHQFQPLFYQVATSGLEPDSIVFPFRKQFKGYKNVSFRLAEVKEIQNSINTVITDKGKLTYDYLVLATGTKTNFFGMEEVERNSLGMKDIRDSLNIRHMMLQNLEQAAITCDDEERDALTNFVIVGGGPAGVEMAGALAEFCKYILPKDYPEYPSSIMNIYLVEAMDEVLSAMSDKASSKTLTYLENLNVKVMLKESVSNYDGRVVKTKSGKTILAKNLIWTAGVTGDFPKGFDETSIVKGNRLKTDHHLKVYGMDNVFAIGDIAGVITDETPKGYPQVAQTAIQQGRHLAKVLLNTLLSKPSKPFTYKDKGSLATVGKRKAVADLGKFHFGGYAAWLLWSVVHLVSISGFRNKLLVGFNWAISYFTYEKSNRVIIRSFKRTKKVDAQYTSTQE